MLGTRRAVRNSVKPPSAACWQVNGLLGPGAACQGSVSTPCRPPPGHPAPAAGGHRLIEPAQFIDKPAVAAPIGTTPQPISLLTSTILPGNCGKLQQRRALLAPARLVHAVGGEKTTSHSVQAIHQQQALGAAAAFSPGPGWPGLQSSPLRAGRRRGARPRWANFRRPPARWPDKSPAGPGQRLGLGQPAF